MWIDKLLDVFQILMYTLRKIDCSNNNETFDYLLSIYNFAIIALDQAEISRYSKNNNFLKLLNAEIIFVEKSCDLFQSPDRRQILLFLSADCNLQLEKNPGNYTETIHQ